jgi:hypothetical protein
MNYEEQAYQLGVQARQDGEKSPYENKTMMIILDELKNDLLPLLKSFQKGWAAQDQVMTEKKVKGE